MTKCKRCGGEWSDIPVPPERVVTIVAQLIDHGERAQAMQQLREFGLSLRDAKAVITHFAEPWGKCQRCHSLVAAGLAECGKCQSVNYNWRAG